MDLEDIGVIAVLVGIAVAIIAVVVAIGYGVTFFNTLWYDGIHYSADVTVQNLETSDKFFQHSYVWVKIEGVIMDRPKIYQFFGRPAVEIGHKYHIEWTDRRAFRIDWGFCIFGEVTKIEEIS